MAENPQILGDRGKSLDGPLVFLAEERVLASGGFLGMGAVSTAEQKAIDRLESAFRSA